MERKVVSTKNDEGKDITIVVYKPSSKQLLEAQVVASNKFKECLKAGVMLKSSVEEELIKQGVWNKEKENELQELGKKLNEAERKLARGAAGGFKKSEARELALNMKDWRIKQTDLFLSKNQLDNWTCEAQAENTEFDYLVATCSKTEDGRPLFETLDDYRERADKPYAFDAATALAQLRNKIDLSWIDKLAENRFLRENGFTNDKGQLINSAQKLIDRDGKLISENGRFVDEENNFVDRDGQKVDADGNVVETFIPWVEDNV